MRGLSLRDSPTALTLYLLHPQAKRGRYAVRVRTPLRVPKPKAPPCTRMSVGPREERSVLVFRHPRGAETEQIHDSCCDAHAGRTQPFRSNLPRVGENSANVRPGLSERRSEAGGCRPQRSGLWSLTRAYVQYGDTVQVGRLCGESSFRNPVSQ